MSEEYFTHRRKEYNYCTILEHSAGNGYSVQYYSIFRYIYRALRNRGESVNIKIQGNTSVNAVCSELQFTISAKTMSKRDVKQTYPADRLRMRLNKPKREGGVREKR